MKCHTQAGSITTNIKVKIYFTPHELRTTKMLTWNCHVDESTKSRYDKILSRDILKDLGLNLKYLIT